MKTSLLALPWCLGLNLLAFGGHAQPTVLSVSPVANTLSASRQSTVSATLSEVLDPASTGALLVHSNRRGGLRSGSSGTTTVSGNTVAFAPTYAWQPGETVRATLTTGLRNPAGQALGTPRVFEFTTATGGTGRSNFLPAAAAPDVAVASSARDVMLGDIDGDGDLDLVAPSPNFTGPGTVSVRLNNGSGVFAPPATNAEVAVGHYCLRAALADVDGDGDLDLLTANANYNGPGSVSVRLNDGHGSFSAPAANAEVAVGTHPVHLALGDVDGDGDLDLVTANETGSVSIRLNNGSGRFTPPALNPDPQLGNTLKFVALGDLDGDGDLDIVAANYGALPSLVNVLLNTGQQTANFQLPATNGAIRVGLNPVSLALGDVDADGDLDLVVGTNDGGPGQLNVRLNNGNASFSNGPNAYVGNAYSLLLGDVDADGDLDVVASAGSLNSVNVRVNMGNGTFEAPPTTPNVAIGEFVTGAALGDVDGDGDLDIVSTNSGGMVSVRFNQPTDALPAPTITAFSPTSGLVGTEVTVSGTTFTSATTVLFNGVAATRVTVVSATRLTATVPAGASTGPITVRTPNGEAVSSTSFFVLPPPTLPTLVVAGLNPARNQPNAPRAGGVAVTFSSPMQDVAATRQALRVSSAQRGGWLTGAASVSGSTLRLQPKYTFMPGEKLFATVLRGPRSVTDTLFRRPYVYQFHAATSGAGRSYLRPGSEVAVGYYPSSVALADVDGDGDLDMITTNQYAATVSVRLNGGDASGSNTGRFSGGQTIETTKGPRQVHPADVDGDGDLDLVLACEGYTGGQVSVRLNGGDASGSNTGRFSGGNDIRDLSSPYNLALGDIDGDGDLDMVTADRSLGYIHVTGNGGAGLFGVNYRIPAGRDPSGVALGDVDGDGDLDLVFASGGDGTVRICLNEGNERGGYGGRFNPQPAQELLNGNTPANLLLADIDGDGHLDLLVGNEQDGVSKVLVYRNTGATSGSGAPLFGPATGVAVAGTPRRIALADLDADGDLDLAITYGSISTSVSVRLNGGDNSGSNTGVFSGEGNYEVGISPQGLALGDVDGDGDVDVLTVGQSNSAVSVRLNTDGGGVLSSPATTVCAGSNQGTLTLNYAVGTVLGYQANTGSGYTNLPGTELAFTFTNLSATTTFRAVLRNPANEIVYSEPVTITVLPLPVVALAAAGPTTVCADTSVRLTTTTDAPGYTYQFLRDGQPIASATATIYAATASGSYTVRVTSSAGCSTVSGAVVVRVNPVPVRPTVSVSYAPGPVLTSSAPTGNQWYLNGTALPGATATTLATDPHAAQGSYTVITTSDQGCASQPSLPLVITTTRSSSVPTALQVYPNPTPDGRLTVLLPNKRGQTTLLNLYNLTGQLLLSRTVLPTDNQVLLDIGTLPAGAYLLRSVTPQGSESRLLIRN
ncbi:VCBS repeat-containing protein [Hymenobacter sp. ISL-91]|uniref:FG-GAP-like repeat-containing protein n=1 Tax=Hymenobacter sp. ISL-91 TaxID=2819151 RepID=UPI001BE5106B|nr:FG-GAP-like repeat-containing protein [Hymenobacter sp. ISL-91]MBT2556853.1 VCBS repeat-containing protein [Hymenobacter sp. ISL-91]